MTAVEIIRFNDGPTDASPAIPADDAAFDTLMALCHFNPANSCSVFNQWCKDLELATGVLAGSASCWGPTAVLPAVCFSWCTVR